MLFHAPSSIDLNIQATISPSFIGGPRFSLVPPRLRLISLTGTFVSFHNNVAIVEVDDLTYLARPHGEVHVQNDTAHFIQQMESID